MSSHPRPTSHSQSGQQHQTGANGHRGPLLVNGHRQSLQQHQDQKRNYLGQDQDYDGNDLDQDLNRMRDLPMESPLSQARSNHHPSPAEDRSSSTMRQESHSEQQRSCNGYTYTSTHQDHGQTQSYPTRRLSTSTHSSPVSTVSSTTSISYTSGTAVSTPSSPSHSTLPYSHGDPRYSGQGFEDASTSSGETAGTGTENETEMNVLTRTTHVNGGFTSGQAEGLIRRSRTRSKSHPDLPDVPLMKACQSSSFGCSSPMAILFVISAIVLGCVFHSNFYRQIDASRDCNMTFMQPKHYKLMGFDQERTAFAGKYGLLLFRDQYDYKLHVPQNMITELPYSVLAIDKKFKLQPLGIPALFIPGNAGSAKQVRSIAKEASRYYYEESLPDNHRTGKTLSRPIDFFTVDFNEEFSALHGHSLLEQAEYLNDAIAYILSLYDDDRHTDPNSARPTSVLIIGHSMGGIVARSLFTMKNYRPGTVNTILTVATPHMLPPVTLDFEISGIYDRIEAFWTNGFQGGEDAPLKDVSLVSIAGGTLDIIVSGDSGNIHNIVPQSHGFTVFTSSIPHAWVGSDHLSILWCNQIAVVIGKALIDIVDASYPEQVKPLSERMDIFRNRLLTGVDTHLEDPDNIHRDEMYDLKSVAHTFVDSTNQLVYPLDQRSSNVADTNQQHMYILRVPRTQRIDTFNMLTDHLLGAQSRLDVLLCNDISGGPRLNNAQPDRLSCFHNSLSTIPIPASTESTTRPLFAGRNFKGDEFRYATEKMSESTLSDIQYLVLLDRGQKMGEPGFLIAEFVLEADTTVIAETTTLGLLNHGYRIHAFPEKSSLVSTLKLPNIDNSLLTYKIKVERNGCSGYQRFLPLLRQSSWTMYEDRFAVNVVAQESGHDINFHGDLPYYERVQLAGKKGIELRFWMDPSCPVPLSLNLQVDKYGGLGKVVIRYRMVVLVFTFLAVILTLRAQFREWNRGGPFMPFGVVLGQLIKTTFWKFSLLLAAFALFQSMWARTAYVFEDPTSRTPSMFSAPVPYNSTGHAAEEIIRGPGGSRTDSGVNELTMSAYDQMIHARVARNQSWFSAFRLSDALLGTNDPFFWFLAPVFFQLSIGIVILIWIALNGLVKTIAGVLSCVSRRGGRYVLGRTIGGMLTKRSRGVRRRVITTIILFIMVATFVPYQFAFVVAVLVHIVACVRSLLLAQATTSFGSQAAWDRHHYLMSIFVMFFLLLPCTLPVLMVWIRNLSVQWYEPFSSDHRLDYIAPFIFFVEAVTDGAMVPRTPEKGYAAITIGILNYMVIFLVFCGVRYSWQIYFLSRIWITWLLVLQLKDTELARKILKPIENQVRSVFSPTKKRK